MKIFLASSAPGHEGPNKEEVFLNLPRRLLSYDHIKRDQFNS